MRTQDSSVQTEDTELQQLKERGDDKRYTVNKITGQSAQPGEGRLVGADSIETKIMEIKQSPSKS